MKEKVTTNTFWNDAYFLGVCFISALVSGLKWEHICPIPLASSGYGWNFRWIPECLLLYLASTVGALFHPCLPKYMSSVLKAKSQSIFPHRYFRTAFIFKWPYSEASLQATMPEKCRYSVPLLVCKLIAQVLSKPLVWANSSILTFYFNDWLEFLT